MSVLKPRNRLVYFRISEDEFRKVEDIWQAEGARSISDLPQAAEPRVSPDRTNSPDAMLREKLKTIDEIIGQLNQKLEQLTMLLGAAGPNGNGDCPESPESPGGGSEA